MPFNGSQSDSKGFFLFGIKRFQKMIKLQYDVVHHRCIEVEELSVVQDAIGFTSHKTLLISFGREMLRFYHHHHHHHHHHHRHYHDHHHHHDDVGDHQADNSRRTTPSLPPTEERCRTASTLLRSDIYSINYEDCHGDDDDDNDDDDADSKDV